MTKSLWRSLKDLGMPSKNRKSFSGSIGHKSGDGMCFDKVRCAETVSAFYTTVASKLVEKLPKTVNTFRKKNVESFYQNNGVISNSYSFSIVSENKV